MWPFIERSNDPKHRIAELEKHLTPDILPKDLPNKSEADIDTNFRFITQRMSFFQAG